MNRKSIVVAAALLAATASTIAIEAEQIPMPTYSAVNREEVKAELRDLRHANALPANNEASPSPLEALELDKKRADLTTPIQIADATDRSDGDAVMERYVERYSASDDVDAHVATTTVWVPANSVLVIEELPQHLQDPAAQAAAPDITEIFQHPAVSPAMN